MKAIGIGEQQVKHFSYRADGSITVGGTPQLVLPESPPRSLLVIQNISDTTMFFEFGSARAHATISGGAVTSVTVDNGGFNFTIAPIIEFLGGGNSDNSSFLGLGMPGQYTSPKRPAQARCVLSGGSVASVTVDDGGSGYVKAPYVFIRNSENDPYGCADPSAGGGSGISLATGQGVELGPMVVITDSVAVYCASSSKKFTCLFTT